MDEDAHVDADGMIKRNRKLSTICEVEEERNGGGEGGSESDGNGNGDVQMEDVQFVESPVEQQMWTHRGGNFLQR